LLFSVSLLIFSANFFSLISSIFSLIISKFGGLIFTIESKSIPEKKGCDFNTLKSFKFPLDPLPILSKGFGWSKFLIRSSASLGKSYNFKIKIIN
jgi:hypothetical protein